MTDVCMGVSCPMEPAMWVPLMLLCDLVVVTLAWRWTRGPGRRVSRLPGSKGGAT